MITITIEGPQGSGKSILADIIEERIGRGKIRLPFQCDEYVNIVKIFDGIKIPKKLKCDIAIIVKQEE
jgi:uridine kinase